MTIIPNLPIPRQKSKGRKYPELYELEVGEAASFPEEAKKSLAAVVVYIRLREGKIFTLRTIGQLTTVWRIS